MRAARNDSMNHAEARRRRTSTVSPIASDTKLNRPHSHAHQRALQRHCGNLQSEICNLKWCEPAFKEPQENPASPRPWLAGAFGGVAWRSGETGFCGS